MSDFKNSNLQETYESYNTEQAPTGLDKDPHSKNISISDWNTLVEYLNLNIEDIKRLYGILKTIDSRILSNNSVLSQHIASENVLARHIKEGSIYENLITNAAVTADKIASGAVIEDKIADGNVTYSKLKDGAVNTSYDVHGNVLKSKLSANAVYTDIIKDGSVTNAKMSEDSVSMYNLQDSCVTKDKIASNAVRTVYSANGFSDNDVMFSNVADKAITESKLSQDVQTKLGKAYVNVSYDSETGILTFTGNDSSVTKDIDLPLELIVTGGSYDAETKDITLNLANGTPITIPLDAVVDKLSGSIADLTVEKFDKFLNPETEEYESQIVTDQIKDGVVTEDKIADNAVTTDKIADSAITSEKLGNYAVRAMNLNDGAVGYSKLQSSTTRADLNNSFSSVSYDGHELQLKANGGTIKRIELPLNELEKRIENLEGLTLTTIEDSTVAHEKVVPVGVGKYAVINKVGGMSYKPLTNNNMCAEDGVYTLNEADSFAISLGVLEKGTYYFSFVDDFSGDGEWGISIGHNYNSYNTNPLEFTVGETAECSFNVVSEDTMYANGLKINGTIKNFMLCKADDADKTYKPYQPPMLLNTKPTSLESRGANLFDESAITGASNNNLVPTNAYGVVENGYLKAKYSHYASSVYWLPFSIKLTKGTYTISADMYVGNVCPSLNIVIGLGAERKLPITARTNLYAYDTWERKSVTITLAEDNIYYFAASGMGDSTNYTKLDVRFKDIQIQRGETATEFHPFSAEPIDTKSLPEAVQSLEGWGLGINAEYNNHIEWRNGRVIYKQVVKQEIFKGTEAWYLYKDAYIFWREKKNGKIGYQTSICDRYENVDGAFSTNNVGTYCDHPDLSRIYVVTEYETADEWKAYLAERYANGTPVVLVYVLETPIETDITHLFTDYEDFLFIEVEPGGTLKFVNEDGTEEAVPSTVTYITKA